VIGSAGLVEGVGGGGVDAPAALARVLGVPAGDIRVRDRPE
jgi:hypothetical protein